MDVKGVCAACANRTRLLDVYASLRARLTKSQVAVLLYHRVCAGSDNWALKPLNVRSFEKQIEYLCRNFEIISLAELAKWHLQGKTLPKRAVAITFDDGYKDNYIHAYPILKKHHVPATVFLATGYIGTGELFWWDKAGYIIWHTSADSLELGDLGNYRLRNEAERLQAISTITERLKKLPEDQKVLMIEKMLSLSHVDIPHDTGHRMILSWDEVRQMSSDGFSFGAHTVTHPILTNIPIEQAKSEIIQSKKHIEEKLGKETIAFSYPNGNYNLELVNFVRSCGFKIAVSVLPVRLISLNDDLYLLGRIGARENFDMFKIIFCGLWEDLHRTGG